MAEEWQEAMTVAEIERIIKTTEPREMSSNGDRVWTRRMAEALHGRLAAVERTIANEALRRAAEAVEQRAVEVGRQECCGHGVGYGEHQECCGSPDFVITDRDAATAIRALIKEPGHE